MSYRELYFQLFIAVTGALAALQCGQTTRAMQILLRASELAEEAHMETDLLPDQPVE